MKRIRTGHWWTANSTGSWTTKDRLVHIQVLCTVHNQMWEERVVWASCDKHLKQAKMKVEIKDVESIQALCCRWWFWRLHSVNQDIRTAELIEMRLLMPSTFACRLLLIKKGISLNCWNQLIIVKMVVVDDDGADLMVKWNWSKLEEKNFVIKYFNQSEQSNCRCYHFDGGGKLKCVWVRSKRAMTERTHTRISPDRLLFNKLCENVSWLCASSNNWPTARVADSRAIQTTVCVSFSLSLFLSLLHSHGCLKCRHEILSNLACSLIIIYTCD